MRTLNIKQKRMLVNTLQTYPNIYSHDNLPAGILRDLEDLNDHETIYQNIDRFINDYRFTKDFDWRKWK